MLNINGHGHLLPSASQIPSFMKDKKFFWISEDNKFMCQGNWKRPITDPSFFLTEKIEWMEQNKIDHEVVLTLSQLYCNGVNEQDTYDIIRFQNDFHAQVQREHPDKFTTGFVVQPAYLDQALCETERCVEELGLSMMCLSTHFQNAQGEWVSIADESVYPLFELANKYNLAIQVHPYDSGKMVNLDNQYWRHHLVWMMAQTADTHMMYTLKGLADKFPNVRVCFAHGSMLSQANFGRVVQGMEGRPDLFTGATHPKHALQHKNIFFDTLVHDVDTLALMVKRSGSEQLIWGVDDPYPLGEMNTVEGCYPGIFLDHAVQQNVITKQQRQQMCNENILRWLNKTL